MGDMLMPTYVEENIVVINEHLRRYWLFDGQAVVYELRDDDRATIDAWFAAVTDVMADWSADKPAATIHDMRHVSLTPYARAKSSELSKNLREVRGYSAVVVANTVYGAVVKTFANLLSWQTQPNIKRQVFTSLEDACAYIEQMLQQESAKEKI